MIDRRVALPTLVGLAIQTAIIAFGGGMIYAAVTGRVTQNEVELSSIRERVAILETERLASSQARTQLFERVEAMRDDIREIKEIVLRRAQLEGPMKQQNRYTKPEAIQ